MCTLEAQVSLCKRLSEEGSVWRRWEIMTKHTNFIKRPRCCIGVKEHDQFILCGTLGCKFIELTPKAFSSVEVKFTVWCIYPTKAQPVQNSQSPRTRRVL